jgi:ankyrin repeat protein
VAFLLAAAAACASCGPSADDLRTDPHGHLIWAARRGDVTAIRSLAASGSDLDAAGSTPLKFVFPDFDHRDWTAIQHAAQKHQLEAVRVLLEWGADPDARGAGFTALLIAAARNDPAAVKLLLDAGADIDTSRKLAAQEPPGGPLWHFIERARESPSPTDALEHMLATSAPSRP